jgi:hypothetical protein
VIAVVRGVVFVAIREVLSAPMRLFACRVAGWSLVWVLASLALARYLGGAETTVNPATLALWSVLTVAFFLPAAILLASAGRRARQATLGAALSAAVTAVVLTSWVLPATSRALFPGIWAPESGTRVPAPAQEARATLRATLPVMPMEFLGKQSSTQLVAQVVSGPPDGWSAIAQLSFRAAFVALCGVMPFAGLVLHRQPRVLRHIGVAAALGLVLYPSRVDALIAPEWILWMFVSSWVPVALLGVGAAASLTRRCWSAVDDPRQA